MATIDSSEVRPSERLSGGSQEVVKISKSGFEAADELSVNRSCRHAGLMLIVIATVFVLMRNQKLTRIN